MEQGSTMEFLIIGVPALLLGSLAGYVGSRWVAQSRRASAQKSADAILAQAEREAESTRKEAELKVREELFQRREGMDKELDSARKEVREHERRVQRLEDS